MASTEFKTCVMVLEFKEPEDGSLGFIEGYGATFEPPERHDWYGDIIDPKAFDEDLPLRGPQGSNEISSLWSHEQPFGMPVSLTADSKGLRLKIEPTDTAENVDRMKYIRHGVVRGLSIQYVTLEHSYVDDVRTDWGSKVRKLLKIKIIEVGPTPVPANPYARIDGVKTWRQTKSGMWEPKSFEAEDRRRRAAAWLKRSRALTRS